MVIGRVGARALPFLVKVFRADFLGRLDGVTRTPQGGIRATANLTRTGVFLYQTSDGKPFRELRHPEEVFQEDSLATLKGAPLTIGHPGMVTTENWKDVSVGHVADDVRANGQFVTATVLIQDAKTCAAIESGELRELSCGYEVELELGEGEFEGEHYDAAQRNPRYNHVALGGTDWGRAGRDVRIVLDAAYAHAMPTSGQRTDAPTNDSKDLDAARADANDARKERDSARADLANEKKRADTLEAERDSARKDADDAKKKLEDQAKGEAERVDSRVELVTNARKVLGDKYDAKGKTDREVREAALKHLDAKADFAGKSDAYVEAMFDIESKKAVADQKDAGRVNEAIREATNTDASESPIDAANKKRAAEREVEAKAGPPAGATVRK